MKEKKKAVKLLAEFGKLMILVFGLAELIVSGTAMVVGATSFDYTVPIINQLSDTDIGASACGPTSITMLLNYYYPNSGVLMPEVYHAGLQYYTYNEGPATGYVDISFAYPNIGFERAAIEFRGYYSGDYSGMRGSPIGAQYLNQIWGGVSVGTSDGSVLFEDVISEIKKRPVILNILYEGTRNLVKGEWELSGHYVVLRGYDDMGTPSTGDDIFYINDPYKGRENRNFTYSQLFGTRVWSGGYTPTGWFKRNWITFNPTLSELQRKYTVVVDNIVSNNNFELDDINATDAFGEYIWKEFYGAPGGDWLYAIESGQTVKHWAQWKPILLTDGDGYYDISTVFYDNNAGSDVEYAIYRLCRRTLSFKKLMKSN